MKFSQRLVYFHFSCICLLGCWRWTIWFLIRGTIWWKCFLWSLNWTCKAINCNPSDSISFLHVYRSSKLELNIAMHLPHQDIHNINLEATVLPNEAILSIKNRFSPSLSFEDLACFRFGSTLLGAIGIMISWIKNFLDKPEDLSQCFNHSI